MRTITGIAASALAALVLSGCATVNAGSYMARDLDVSRYRTYDWGPADALPIGDPRLDDNPFFHDHFQGAMDRALAAKGYRRVFGGDADLLLHYHASVSWRAEVDAFDRSRGLCTADGCVTPDVLTYEQGTLVVDAIDPRTKRMVWRGWAEDRYDGAFDTRRSLERTIDASVRKLMERFPAN